MLLSHLPRLSPSDNPETALRDRLERTGAWSKLRARVRAEVILSAGGDQPQPPPETAAAAADDKEDGERCSQTNDPTTFLINELIREHLMFHGLRDTLSVFLAESGQPMLRPYGRAQLESEALSSPSPSPPSSSSVASLRLPLLYSLLGGPRARTKAGELQ